MWLKIGFERGYFAYQSETVARLIEARARGMSSDDWFHAEIQRATGIVVVPYEKGES